MPPPAGEVIVWESAQPMATAQVIPRVVAMRRREEGEKEGMAGSFEILKLSARGVDRVKWAHRILRNAPGQGRG